MTTSLPDNSSISFEIDTTIEVKNQINNQSKGSEATYEVNGQSFTSDELIIIFEKMKKNGSFNHR